MGKHRTPRSSARRLPQISLTTAIVTVAIVALAAMTVASKQKLTTEKNEASQRSTAAANHAGESSRFQSPDIQNGVQDPEKIAGGLRQLVNQSTDGLVEVQHADGSVSVNLDGRFQNVTVARVNANGSLSQACVDNPRAAGAFFGVDPKLIENQPHTPVAPARKDNQ